MLLKTKKPKRTSIIGKFFYFKYALIIHAIFSLVFGYFYCGILPWTGAALEFIANNTVAMFYALLFLYAFQWGYIRNDIHKTLDRRIIVVALFPALTLSYWLLFPLVSKDQQSISALINLTYVSMWMIASLIYFKRSEKIERV